MWPTVQLSGHNHHTLNSDTDYLLPPSAVNGGLDTGVFHAAEYSSRYRIAKAVQGKVHDVI